MAKLWKGETLNEFFDKVYLINLPSAPGRLSAATENCAKVRIEFEVVSALSGENEEVVMNTKPHTGWNRNAAALGLTTLNIVKNAKEKGYKNIFIMEDDVDFINFNFGSILKKALYGLPDEWDFFHLNATPEYPSKWVSTCLNRLGGAWCCQAYGINSSMYDKYITELSKFKMPIDNITLDFHRLRKKSYSTSPNIVVHHAGNYSTLRGQDVDY